MPRRLGVDHKEFRDVISGKVSEQLKQAIKSGGIVHTIKTRNGVPLNGHARLAALQQMMGRANRDEPAKKKAKRYRSIDDEWQPDA